MKLIEKLTSASLDCVTAFPDHSNDRTAQHIYLNVSARPTKPLVDLHTCDKALEERLLREIGIVLLEMLLGGSDELQSNQLVSACVQLWSILFAGYFLPSLLETGDDVSDKAAL